MAGEHIHMLQAFVNSVIRKSYGPGREGEQTDFLNRNLYNRIGHVDKTTCPLFSHLKCYLFEQPSLNIATPKQALESHRVVRRRGSYVF
jgi:hypothetical protein